MIVLILWIFPIARIQAQSVQNSTLISPELKKFDNMVRNSRVEMRKYCALVQQLMKAPDEIKQQEAIDHIIHSIELWQEVNAFKTKIPQEYQKDARFSSRLTQIEEKLIAMKAKLESGEYKESFDNCSAACGMFVQMHEDNGLVYAADRLFHLRKLAKKMIAEEQKSGLPAIKGMVGKLLNLRDNVFLAPCPAVDDDTRCQNYQTALKELSTELDELAIRVINDRSPEAKQILGNLVLKINQAYALAL
jgi:hypothetical protein